jgi:uncharacterized protein
MIGNIKKSKFMADMLKTTFQPVKAKERIVLLDILRGFALFGILFANLLTWSGLKYLPIEDIRNLGNFEVDRNIYQIMKFFVDTKFYTLFSLLFGVGFSLQISKNRDNPTFPGLYLWRMALLLTLGIFHSIIWSGDILSLYALMGMILLALRNTPVKKTLYVGLSLFFLPVLLSVVYMYSFARDLPELPRTALLVYPDMTPQEVKAGFQSTDFWVVLQTNLHSLKYRWLSFIPDGRPLKVLGLFFIGGYLYSINFFMVHAKKWKLIALFFTVGAVFSFASLKIEGVVASYSRNWTDVLDKFLHEVGQLSLTLSYICMLAKLVDAFPKFILFTRLKNYGRMSLTSYLGHTLLSILIFYPVVGVGLGYLGRLSLENTYYVAVLILIFQLLFSNIWFRFFAFGPVEWAWRCAAYRKWYPIRIKKN